MNSLNLLGILDPRDGIKPGRVYLANEAAVGNQFLSDALTQFSVGWTSPARELEDLLERLTGAPIPVGKRFGFKKADNAEAFAAVENDADVRAVGGDFRRIVLPGSTVDAHTVDKGLMMRVDAEELHDDPEAEQKAVAHLRTVLLRAEIIRCFSGLAGAATGSLAGSATWGTGENAADADAGVMGMLETAAADSGLHPNVVLYGTTAWQKRFTTLRASSNSAVAGSATLTIEQLAGLFGVRKVDVVRQRYQSGSGKSTLLSNNLVLMYNVQQGGIKDDPSNIKRFISKVGGAEYRVFRKERAEGVDVTVAHNSLIAITSSLGVAKLTIS